MPDSPDPSGRISRDFLSDRALVVAPQLLGLTITVGERSGLIVEVEAYEGANDSASHASGARTARNTIMFGPAGHLYVYRSYGIHWCANVVCGLEDQPGAVLLRAVEPRAGIEAMWTDRPKAKRETDLASGPGKLCAALAIDHDHNGLDLFAPGGPIGLHREIGSYGDADLVPIDVVSGVRVGITKAVDLPWRFAIAGNPHVSRPRF